MSRTHAQAAAPLHPPRQLRQQLQQGLSLRAIASELAANDTAATGTGTMGMGTGMAGRVRAAARTRRTATATVLLQQAAQRLRALPLPLCLLQVRTCPSMPCHPSNPSAWQLAPQPLHLQLQRQLLLPVLLAVLVPSAAPLPALIPARLLAAQQARVVLLPPEVLALVLALVPRSPLQPLHLRCQLCATSSCRPPRFHWAVLWAAIPRPLRQRLPLLHCQPHCACRNRLLVLLVQWR